MSRLPASVKSRRYDVRGRRAAALRRREGILAAGRELMLRDGYAATTVASIAAAAAVSTETVYKAFGGKPGIVRALFRQALDGAGPESAVARSDRLREGATGHALVAGWAELAREVAPRGAPLALLLRDAAGHDPKARSVLDEIERTRLLRMRDNARALVATGDVRPDLSLRDVTDVLFAVSSAELYELLVIRRGWSSRRFARFQRETMAGALLVQETADPAGQSPTTPRQTERAPREGL
ncbi:TetR family transcriptional regulator [Nocardioides mesophilus]|uniref:TetR family transcriptional regulator n=1 Tax=Nocardioides mesophilus TaxID=433659 RepID=A0A7G9RA62_9ACTN|nr:TetR family transcriptional regulator [Nocardioides mesophilus]QNN52487.1 TetR family transcriptional regulator [Nocardioides mesophilus]